jgi:Fe2+ or Zn2+ uptake regulation protein
LRTNYWSIYLSSKSAKGSLPFPLIGRFCRNIVKPPGQSPLGSATLNETFLHYILPYGKHQRASEIGNVTMEKTIEAQDEERPRESKHSEAACCGSNSVAEYVQQSIGKMVKAGFRITQPRREVISCFAAASYPLTIAQLCDALGSLELESRRLSKVSVYRIVADLEGLQLVHRVLPGGGYFRCAHVNCGVHPHVIVTCDLCQRTRETPVPTEYLGPVLFFLRNKGMRLSETPVLRLEGLCELCAQNSGAV